MRHVGNVHTGIGSIFDKVRAKISPGISRLSDKALKRGEQQLSERLDDELPDAEAEERELQAAEERRLEARGRRRLPPASRGEVLDAAQGLVDVLAGLPMSAAVESALNGIDALVGDLSEASLGDDPEGDRQLLDAAALLRTRLRGMGATSQQSFVDGGVLLRVTHEEDDAASVARMAQVVAEEQDVGVQVEPATFGSRIFFDLDARSGALSILDEMEREGRIHIRGAEDEESEGLVSIGNIEDFWGDSWAEADDQRFEDEDDFGSSYSIPSYGY